MTLADTLRLYLDERRRIDAALDVGVLERAAGLLFDVYDAGGTVYAAANGGNAGTLDHAYCDFRHHPFVTEDKSRPLPRTVPRLSFVNLCGSPAELTALANDIGPEWAYAAALEPVVTGRDLLMAYSGSGNSPNVVAALQVARAAGAATFAMTRGDGGRCRELAGVCLVVPGTSRYPGQTGGNDNNFHFEDLMLSVNHMLVGLLKQRVAGG